MKWLCVHSYLFKLLDLNYIHEGISSLVSEANYINKLTYLEKQMRKLTFKKHPLNLKFFVLLSNFYRQLRRWKFLLDQWAGSHICKSASPCAAYQVGLPLKAQKLDCKWVTGITLPIKLPANLSLIAWILGCICRIYESELSS